jgi:hypothetical protein
MIYPVKAWEFLAGGIALYILLFVVVDWWRNRRIKP